MGASVKVMLSYDYCHFEISKSTDEAITDERIDEMRKDCMRLADKAIAQYKTAKRHANFLINPGQIETLRREVRAIKENFPQSEWTEDQKAKVKKLHDHEFLLSNSYDYQDDWYYDYDDLER